MTKPVTQPVIRLNKEKLKEGLTWGAIGGALLYGVTKVAEGAAALGSAASGVFVPNIEIMRLQSGGKPEMQVQ